MATCLLLELKLCCLVSFAKYKKWELVEWLISFYLKSAGGK